MNGEVQKPNYLLEFKDVYNKDGFWATANLFGATPATAANYGAFYTAYWPCEVMAVMAVWETAGTSSTLDVEKVTGTTAVGSGASVLASTISTAGTANTVNYGVLTTTGANRILARGDRLALDDGGTLTNLAGLQVTVYLRRLGKGHYN